MNDASALTRKHATDAAPKPRPVRRVAWFDGSVAEVALDNGPLNLVDKALAARVQPRAGRSRRRAPTFAA